MALKENELRVGNYVKGIAMGLNHKIDLHFFNECYDDDTMLDWYMPIPLTPAILVACGFVEKEIDSYGKYYTGFRLNSGYFTLLKEDEGNGGGYRYFFYCDEDTWYSQGLGMQINSLHQLQNLYFALTGKEITVNL